MPTKLNWCLDKPMIRVLKTGWMLDYHGISCEHVDNWLGMHFEITLWFRPFCTVNKHPSVPSLIFQMLQN